MLPFLSNIGVSFIVMMIYYLVFKHNKKINFSHNRGGRNKYMSDDYSIVIENLNKAYENLQAVDNISFKVKTGEIFGFLGPNGAGKTTTVRMITGVFPPDSGEIQIAGYDMLKKTLEAKMKMGIVPELADAYMDLTALENILFMAELYGLSGKEIREKTGNLLKMFLKF